MSTTPKNSYVIKRPNLRICMTVRGTEIKKKRHRNPIQWNYSRKFLKLKKINIQVQEALKTTNRQDWRRTFPQCSQGDLYRVVRGKKKHIPTKLQRQIYQNSIRLLSNPKLGKECNDVFQVVKVNNRQPRLLFPEKLI